MMRFGGLASVIVLAAFAMHCGGTSDDNAPATPGNEGANGGSSATGTSTEPGGGPASSPNPDDSKADDPAVLAVSACIDGGGLPKECLAKSGAAGAPRDVDQDGLDDVLEDAMLRSYAPVFAFNQGDGGHTAGDDESHYPTNAEHYVSHSTLYWRVDNNESTKRVVDAKPSLAKLSAASFGDGADKKIASNIALGHGPNFWLCLNRDEASGKYDDDALVKSMDASSRLAKGIDIFTVAHPAGNDANGDIVVLNYMLFFSYNAFSFDDHEGDFEGGAVFVSLSTGKVVALYTDRHPSSDKTKLIPVEGAGKLSTFDPAKENPKYTMCSDTADAPTVGGTRFWDFDGAKHHPVVYVSSGGHATYGYPGATKIQGVGCIEPTIIRDVHNGIGPKLVPHENKYSNDWKSTRTTNITGGVHFKNLGERGAGAGGGGKQLREAWSAFAGQWGCTLDRIPKSYPGPWDNGRLCRHWLTANWGNALPLTEGEGGSCPQE